MRVEYHVTFDNGYSDLIIIEGTKEYCEYSIKEIQQAFVGLISYENIKWV